MLELFPATEGEPGDDEDESLPCCPDDERLCCPDCCPDCELDDEELLSLPELLLLLMVGKLGDALGIPEEVLGMLGDELGMLEGELGIPEEELGILDEELGMLELELLGMPLVLGMLEEDDDELEEVWQPVTATANTPAAIRVSCFLMCFEIASSVILGFPPASWLKKPGFQYSGIGPDRLSSDFNAITSTVFQNFSSHG